MLLEVHKRIADASKTLAGETGVAGMNETSLDIPRLAWSKFYYSACELHYKNERRADAQVLTPNIQLDSVGGYRFLLDMVEVALCSNGRSRKPQTINAHECCQQALSCVSTTVDRNRQAGPSVS